MPLHDPVAVYNAKNNVEAHIICKALHAAGIEAHAVEDVSQIGVWMFGLIPEIHKPQVWVERSAVDAVKPVLDEFEHRAKVLRDSKNAKRGSQDGIEVVCEDCGKTAKFPIEQEGSVQDCPHCVAFVDVEEPGDDGDWGEPEADSET